VPKAGPATFHHQEIAHGSGHDALDTEVAKARPTADSSDWLFRFFGVHLGEAYPRLGGFLQGFLRTRFFEYKIPTY